MRCLLIVSLALLLSGSADGRRDDGDLRWWKGNTHTHTLWSDGDAAPELAVDAYRAHGYHFLVLSDHNIVANVEKWFRIAEGKKSRLTPERVEALQEKFGAERVEVRDKDGRREMRLRTLDELQRDFTQPGRFILIPGEEITGGFKRLPIHHNSMNHETLIKPPKGTSVRDVLQKTVAAVEAEERRSGRPMLVHLNHPNFGWGISPDDLAHTAGERYFEVYNGHRGVRNYGDAKHPGTEAMWDHALSIRLSKPDWTPLYGLATDDAHHYHAGTSATAAPRRGWIMVQAAELTPDAIVRAMKQGRFYASSGVTLKSIEVGTERMTVNVAPDPGVTYTIRFIGTRRGGKVGEVLSEVKGATGSYTFRGDELYVRATVVSDRPHPNGYAKGDLETAWVQPAFRVPKTGR